MLSGRAPVGPSPANRGAMELGVPSGECTSANRGNWVTGSTGVMNPDGLTTKSESPGFTERLQRPSASVLVTSRPFDTIMPGRPRLAAVRRKLPSVSSITLPWASTGGSPDSGCARSAGTTPATATAAVAATTSRRRSISAGVSSLPMPSPKRFRGRGLANHPLRGVTIPFQDSRSGIAGTVRGSW
jgi:hypothetical protein